MFTKLFSSITESSLWSEPKEVRLLFVTMLARADQNGFVEASIPGLARVSNLTLEETEKALEVLQNPDPYSKNPDDEGRRIIKVPGGFCLINYEEYRSRRDDVDRKEYMRSYMADYRKKRKQSVNSVNICKQELATVNHGKPPLAQAEAEADTEAEAEIKNKKTDFAISPLLKDPEFCELFEKFKSSSRVNHHWTIAESTVEAWLYALQDLGLDEAKNAIRFSTAAGAKKPITNGDHKQKTVTDRKSGKIQVLK